MEESDELPVLAVALHGAKLTIEVEGDHRSLSAGDALLVRLPGNEYVQVTCRETAYFPTLRARHSFAVEVTGATRERLESAISVRRWP